MIRLLTLGGLSASREGEPPAGAATQPRRLAVLAVLASAGDRGITRERLLGLLWPDSDDASGRRALSQALHSLRADLHEELFLGVQELRLNRAVVSCDLFEFEDAVAGRELERAAAAYAGPFLHGFRLPGAADFERWMEAERAGLAHRAAEVIEGVARAAASRGEPAAAVTWWRRRASMDALNARVTLELMRALVAAGERHSAIRQARIYEALVAEELALEPDAEVVRYAEELRQAPPTQPPRPASPAPPPAVRPPPSPEGPRPDAAPSGAEPRRGGRRVALAAALVVVLAAVLLVSRRRPAEPGPVFAVGAIADYRGAAAPAPLTDMLASSLARLPGLQVISTARLLELMARAGSVHDAAAFAAAARQAGATDLMEGGLHQAARGLRLELRRVDLASGSVRGAWRIEGTDVFELVDAAARELGAGFGVVAPAAGQLGSRSLVAWRFYQEGLRRSARGDHREAVTFYESALAEDSAFAMAAFHWLRARSALSQPPDSGQLAWLTRLAQGAADRDRLQILAWVAFESASPALDALADTLSIRYPTDIESQYLAGFARMARADFRDALPFLHRVIEADSSGVGRAGARCLACDALQLLVYAYQALDSIPRALQVARDWVRRDPESGIATASLGSVLDIQGRHDDAIEARRKSTPYDAYDNIFVAAVRLRAGDFAASDQASRALLANGADHAAAWQGFWLLAISLRYQARWQELLDLAGRRYEAATPADRVGVRGRRLRLTEALALIESGRPRAALRVLDSLAAVLDRGMPPGVRARVQTVLHALRAEVGLALGDRTLTAEAADAAEGWARVSGKTVELGTARHARALAQLAQGDTAAALRTLDAAIYSPTLGFTRTNLHLARLHLAGGRPAQAVPLLRAALQGSLESANYYVTHTELRELLAEAFARLGMPDSARRHWHWVEAALSRSDSAARPRLAAARAAQAGR